MQAPNRQESRPPSRGLLFLFLLATHVLLHAQDADFYIRRAQELELHKDSYWLLLGHYKRSIGGYRSLLDDKSFFLAPDGKRNPQAELEATIRAFFLPKAEGEAHPTYKYTARYKWLCDRLGIDRSALPYDGDENYLAAKERIKPSAVHLVFPAGYMNDPASIFGHVFFLIESEDVPHLTGLAVNYGAVATDPPGLIYAMKGLFGAYHGHYEMMPYYKQITKYSYLDMRDTWEYRLLLDEEETDRMLRHIIEQSFAYSNYFYLSENCAYCLLFPIEAARPETRLTDRFGLIVEPVHTVTRLQDEGLLGEARYRPSLFSTLQHQKSFLTSRQKSYARRLCYGKAGAADAPPADSPEQEAALWEFCADYLKFLLSSRKISQEDYQRRFLAVLSERNKMRDVRPAAQDIPVPQAQPQEAHGSHMLSLGGGIDGRNWYAEAGFRLLAHNMLDTDGGYTANSQLEFFTGAVRFDITEQKFSLRYADVIDVISIPLSDRFIFKPGYQLRAGLASNPGEDGDEDLAWHLKAAGGLSAMLGARSQIYALAGADVYFSPEYQYCTDPLLGGELGLITTDGRWKQRLSASLYQSPLEIRHTRFCLAAEGRVSLSQNTAVMAAYRFRGDWRDTQHEAGCSLRIYF